MYIKLNQEGYIVGFSSRPALGNVAVERTFYSRAKTRYTSESMKSATPVALAFDPEDLYDSISTVKPKLFAAYREVVANRLSIGVDDLPYSPAVDEVSEVYRQIYQRDFLKSDPIGAALAWSHGKVYDPSKPYVAPEAEETEPDEPKPEPKPVKDTIAQRAKKLKEKREQKAETADRQESKAAESAPTNSDEQSGEPKTEGTGDKAPKKKRRVRRKPKTEQEPEQEKSNVD